MVHNAQANTHGTPPRLQHMRLETNIFEPNRQRRCPLTPPFCQDVVSIPVYQHSALPLFDGLMPGQRPRSTRARMA